MKKTLTSLIAAALTAGAVMPFPAYAGDTESVLHDEDWSNYAEQSIRLENTPGLSVAAVSGSETGYRNWGYADLKAQTPMTEDTPVHIGSCSKAFTALAVLLLQEEGKLSAEDSISDYIPWWHVTYHGQDADVKIWQLLNHSSGLPYLAVGCYENADEEDIARLAENMELASEPGAEYRYIDFGYCVLAYLTETVSGMPYDEFVVKKIMQPIGMTHSGFDLPTAQGYHFFWGRQAEFEDVQPQGNAGAALIVSTPADMVLWMKAQLGHLDLPEHLANAIAASHERNQQHQPKNAPDTDYFNGWHQSADRILWHGGQNPNFSTRVIIDPVHDTAVLAVSNSAADTPYYAARSCYMMLSGYHSGHFPEIGRSLFGRCDLYASVISIVLSGLLIASVIMLLTQKKRLAKKNVTRAKEKTRLIVRLAVLLPLLCLAAALPCILGAAAGYSDFGYAAFRVWGLQSVTAACLLLDAWIVCLILTSILRFRRAGE